MALRLAPGAGGWAAEGRTIAVDGYAALPEGWCRPGDPVSLFAGARPFPLQVEPRTLHPDGSVRGLGLVALLPRRGLGEAAGLELRRAPPKRCARGVRALDDGDLLRVDNGVFQLAFARRGPDLLPGLRTGPREWRDGRPVQVVARSGMPALDGGAPPSARSVRLAIDGELRTRIEVAGEVVGDGEVRPGTYRLVIDVIAGSAAMEGWIEVAAASGATMVDEVAWELPVALRPAEARLLPGGATCAAEGPVVVGALDGRTVRGRSGSSTFALDGEAPTGVLGVDRRGGGIGLTLHGARRMQPRSVEFEPSASLRLVVHDGPMLLEPGARLRAAFTLAIGGPGIGVSALVDALAVRPMPALRGADPFRATAGEPVNGGLDPSLDPTARLLEAMDAACAAVTGRADHGDYRLGRGFANLEYDPARSFLDAWARGGDARQLRIAEAMLSHLSLHDLSDGEAGTPPGFPYQHGATHRSGRVDAGHVWTGGLAQLVGLTRAPWAAPALARMRAGVLEVAGRRGVLDSERAFGWVLLALLDLRRAMPGDDLDGAIRDLRRRLVATQRGVGHFAIDRGEGGLHAPTPWVTAGITVEALHQAEAALPDAAGGRAIGRAIDFVLREARRPDGRYAARVRFGTDGVAVRDGVADGAGELMIAAGLARAAAGGHGPARDELAVILPRAVASLAERGASPNQVARALVALRALRGP